MRQLELLVLVLGQVLVVLVLERLELLELQPCYPREQKPQHWTEMKPLLLLMSLPWREMVSLLLLVRK